MECKIKIYNLSPTLRVIFILDNEHTNTDYNKNKTDKENKEAEQSA